MQFISSRQNPKITFAASLSDKKNRDATGEYLIEGRKLFEEAIKRGVCLTGVFVTEKMQQKLGGVLDELSCEVYIVTDSVYQKLSRDKSPDGVLCTARIPNEKDVTLSKPFIICDMQDAGNLGTCIRTALALGISPLIIAGDCADVYNPKTVRASMGAVFSQSILRFEAHADAVTLCRDAGFTVYAAALSPKARAIDELDKTNAVFVVGNEGHGLPSDTINACDGAAIIPMEGESESLNAAVAASILMWETK